jgi:hypothetical protein
MFNKDLILGAALAAAIVFALSIVADTNGSTYWQRKALQCIEGTK